MVTGGSSGIGEGIVRHYAAAGAAVAVTYGRHRDEAEETARQINASGGKALATGGDIALEADVLRMFEETKAGLGAIDIVVANAGLQDDAKVGDMTVEQWDHVMGVNLRGQFLAAREAIRTFRQQGDRRVSRARGKVICVSSVHEIVPWAGHVNYAASKGGVMLMMKTLAQEVGPEGIRVNGIAPGAIATPINRSAWETSEAEAQLNKLIPYERVGVPDDIGAAAVWLASDASDYVIGHSLLIDGGMALYRAFADNG